MTTVLIALGAIVAWCLASVITATAWHLTKLATLAVIARRVKRQIYNGRSSMNTRRCDVKRCHYCGPTDEELRPYGPGGSLICFPCMKADPERERAAAGRYMALLDATSTLGLTAIGTEAGPINVDPAELGLITPAVIPPHNYECALVASDGNAPCDCRVTPAVVPGGGDTA